MWNLTLDAFLTIKCGMGVSDADFCLYTRYKNKKLELAITVYVENILLLSKDDSAFPKAKEAMKKRFEMKNLGSVKWFLGSSITSRPEGTYMKKTSCKMKELRSFYITYSKFKSVPMTGGKNTKTLALSPDETPSESFPFRELIGYLLYLAVFTRPDISHAVPELALFFAYPHECHWNALKGI